MTGAAPQAPMDPKASLPAGEPLLLSIQGSSAPLVRGRAVTRAEASARGPKPLRSPKQRPPVATGIDRGQVWTPTAPAQVRAPTPPVGGGPPRSPSAPAAGVPTLTLTTFNGGRDDNTSIPPDTSGAVGPHHVMSPLNNNVSIFDRTGALLSSLSLDGFWAALGINASTFDPRVVFDPFEGRFVLVTMADAERPTSSLLVAVSTTSDPMATWVGDAIQVDDAAQGEVWLDFPSVGFSADKVTVQVNMFTRDGNRFAGSTIYVFDKTSLYEPPHQAVLQRFVLLNQGATHVPAVTYDATVSDQYLLARWAGNLQGTGYLLVYRVTGSVATNQASLVRVGFVASGGATWDSFPPNDFAPQNGIRERVDVGDDRVLSVCYRQGSLYASQTVMLPAGGMTRSAVQWWEIDVATWAVTVLGRVDDSTAAVCYTYPTLAVNRRGDLLIGHAQFSALIHPSASYVFKPSGGPAQPPVVFAAGQDTYLKTFSGSTNRWGDYSSTQVDPENDQDFWTVQEYADTPANTWATMWARIQV